MTPDDESKPVTEAEMRPHMIRGSIWMVAMRWTIKGIGIVSTIILARLLVPEDFGIVAMAMLVVGIIELFNLVGTDLALIRHKNATRAHFDSAWTLGVIQSLILGTCVLLAAPLGEAFFDEPRAVPVIQVLSLRVYAQGFENIGTVLFLKELNFAKEFWFRVARKVGEFAVTLTLAVTIQNYWALVAGIVGGQILFIVLSYVLHPYRPRLCFTKIPELWSFSMWTLVYWIGHYGSLRMDEIIVGRISNSQAMGHYYVGSDVATTPTAEMIAPLGRALFPSYSRLQDSPKQLYDAYLNVLSAVTLICFATGTGLALVAHDLVVVFLGEKWVESIPIMFWIAFAAAVFVYSNTAMTVLLAAGFARRAAVQIWLRNGVLLAALIYAGMRGDLTEIAAMRLWMTLLFVPLFFYSLRVVIPIKVRDVLDVTWRPAIAAAAMAGVLHLIPDDIFGDLIALRLFVDVAAGSAVYAVTVLGLWYAAGQPPGSERAAMRAVRGRLKMA